MKTYKLISKNSLLIGLNASLAVIVASCGSYQNSSYYDNDGVYGSNNNNGKEVTVEKTVVVNDSKAKDYEEQFKTMTKDYSYFTDVDNYNGTKNDSVVTVYNNQNRETYGGWGSNTDNVVVNVYDYGWNTWHSPFWGYRPYWNAWNMGFYGAGWGFGWNWNYWSNPYWGWNSWYGPGWGGFYGGWGWNNWYGNPYGYGYYRNNVAINNGRRGGINYANSGRTSNNSTFTGRQRTNSSFSTNSTNPRGNTPRTQTTGATRNPRNNNATSQTGGVRPSSNPRTETSSIPRSSSSTPRSNNYSTPRSSNFGGGRSGGSY